MLQVSKELVHSCKDLLLYFRNSSKFSINNVKYTLFVVNEEHFYVIREEKDIEYEVFNFFSDKKSFRYSLLLSLLEEDTLLDKLNDKHSII